MPDDAPGTCKANPVHSTNTHGSSIRASEASEEIELSRRSLRVLALEAKQALNNADALGLEITIFARDAE
ncbi:hypothetical protein EMIT0158MI4_40068 [Burkholderia ambifaria]